VIMAANDGERKAARSSASPAFRLELAAVSSAVVGLGLELARRRKIPRATPASPACCARACLGRQIQAAMGCSRTTIAKVAKRAA
jgi:hypothetical protein